MRLEFLVCEELSAENFKMVGLSRCDESILEREKGQGYVSIDGKMEYESLAVLS